MRRYINIGKSHTVVYPIIFIIHKSITGRGKDYIKTSTNQPFATLQPYSLNLKRRETMDLIGLFAQNLGVLIL